LRKLHNGLIFAVSALLIYFLLFVNIPSLVEAQTQRWYAGYFYAGTPISAPWGVSGKIYTINPQVPALTTMFQWVTVVLSYVNDYWLQVGYDKTNSLFHPTYITYYWECVSQRGSYTHRHFSGNPGPAAGSWHSYTIVYAQSSQFPERWILRVDSGTPPDNLRRKPVLSSGSTGFCRNNRPKNKNRWVPFQGFEQIYRA